LGTRDEREEATVVPGTNGTATSLSASRPPTDVAAIENVEQKAERHKAIKAEVDAQIMQEIKGGAKVSSQERQRRHQAAIDKAEATPVHPIAVEQATARSAADEAAQTTAAQEAEAAADAAAKAEAARKEARTERAARAAKLPKVPVKKSTIGKIVDDAAKKGRRRP
jgi:hypothetical protein